MSSMKQPGVTVPRPEHPRPDFERADWLNLNGPWEFEFDDQDVGERNAWWNERSFTRTITVPFCYQSALSGIGDTSTHPTVWYKRSFTIPGNMKGKRLLLHFGAVDYEAKIWVNGTFAGEHTGGSTPFQFDITNLIADGDNTITLRASDELTRTDLPRGKQRWKEENFGCWYTPVTGIWQTVWIEAISDVYLQRVKITPDLDQGLVRFDALLSGSRQGTVLKAAITFEGKDIAEASIRCTRDVFSFEVDVKSNHFHWNVAAWSPEDPKLYDVRFTLTEQGQVVDEVDSYFGMRKVSVKNGMVMLNNRPIYQRLVLDQGYFDGGLLTAGSDEDFIRDIKLTKEFGFNGVRKHQKVEDPRYLYWADKLGLLVWGEMGSAYEFNDRMMTANMEEWRRSVERDYNHPSIIAWTLMNESWGIPQVLTDAKQQHHTKMLYYMVKSYDQTRLVISNDGWEHTVSDVLTFHDYTQDGNVLADKLHSKESILQEPVCSVGNALGAKYMFAEGSEYEGQPIILSECCGVAFDSGEAEGWGYGENVKSKEEFLERYRSIIRAIYANKYIVGFCSTQLTDVEQEINGLVTMKREPKVDPAEFARIIRNL